MHCFIKKNLQNCYICAMRLVLLFGLGMSYMRTAKCQHYHPVGKARLEENRYILLLNTSYVIFCSVSLYSHLGGVLRSQNDLKLFIEESFFFLEFLAMLCYLACARLYQEDVAKYTENIMRVIDKRKFFGVDEILSRGDTKLIRLLSFLHYFIYGVYIVSVPFYFKYANLRSDAMYLMGVMVHYFGYCNLSGHMVFTEIMYLVIFKNYCVKVKRALAEDAFKRRYFVEKLQYLQRYYMTICFNHKEHLLSVGNFLMYSGIFVSEILILVSGCLYYFYCFHRGERPNYMYAFLNVVNALTIVFFTKIVDQLRVTSEDLISYLYKYPISKLSPLEAAQVETFITILTLRKPEVRASDIFTVGTNLLSSIFGTVVTYVLVALQFYASFSEP